VLGRSEKLSVRHWLGARQMAWGIFHAVVFWAVASLIVVVGRSDPNYRVAELVDRPVFTRVDLVWEDVERTQLERLSAREKAPSVYVPNAGFYEKIRQELVSLPVALASVETVDDVADELVRNFALDDGVVRVLRTYQTEGTPNESWKRMVDKLINDLRWLPIVRPERYQLEKAGRSTMVELILSPGERKEVGKELLVNLGDTEKLLTEIRSRTQHFPEPVRPSIEAYFRQVGEPGYVLEPDATAASREAAEQAVVPIRRTYKAGEVIVDAGKSLDKSDADLLGLEHRKYLASHPTLVRWLSWAGPAIIVLLVTVGISATVVTIRPRVAENPTRGLALTALLLGTLAMALLLEPTAPYVTIGVAVGAAMLAAVILAIAYDQQFAIAVSSLQVVLIALALNMSVGSYFVALAACVLAIAQLRRVRHRSTLVRMGLVTGLVVGAGAFAVGLAETNFVDGIFVALGWQALAALIAAMLVGFFVLGILPFVEKVFKVTTAMTLLELGDVNRPLLRRLAQAAPGTFNHSLTIAIIAEAAAEAIGADGLLCRVGAYYHDIGKMNKPQYFIENQGGGPNRHEKLSPAMSLLIIVGHVKDGMEMAKEYGLPRCLHQFIASHHGTTLVEYFYHAAKKQAGEGDAQPSEFEFRYPGPKPQSREAAILMLCDTVESASRTLPDPTPNRIEQLVHKLAMKRLMDGQFDESSITLEELHRVEEAITKSLSGIYHGRIKYPEKSRDQPREPQVGKVAG